MFCFNRLSLLTTNVLKVSNFTKNSNSLFLNINNNEFNQVRFATKKSGGSSKNGRTSLPKNLGVKKSNGAEIKAGGIIVRQRGLKFKAGVNVGIGRDHTLYSLVHGNVRFGFDQTLKHQFICVIPKNKPTPIY
eukprot:TRINITY_DN1478_c0_g2_i1.p1 TRINITY_DN1478_c0_g2~~TRINITY_DN1478_c0_g2_i1.p1  ORF type:complete len:133 (-),score=43.97 TRINITY_DN1478_c0_g2_i1:308-706(-)